MDASIGINQPSGDSAEKTITVIGFGRRLLATLTDGVLLAALTFIAVFAIGFVGILIQMYNPYEPLPIPQLTVVVGIVISVIYYVRAWSASGQTIGKTLLGMKVVTKDGSYPSGGKAFLRYIGYLVSGIVLSIGFLWVAFDRKRQGWHDKIAGTYVISIEDEFSASDGVKLVPSDLHQRNWVWLIVWVAIAILVPPALLGSLWLLGPVIHKIIVSFTPF